MVIGEKLVQSFSLDLHGQLLYEQNLKGHSLTKEASLRLKKARFKLVIISCSRHGGTLFAQADELVDHFAFSFDFTLAQLFRLSVSTLLGDSFVESANQLGRKIAVSLGVVGSQEPTVEEIAS